MRDYIPIEKDNIPERFLFDLADETFLLEVNYNDVGDFFTIDLYGANENPIVLGEKMVLGMPLWCDIVNPNLPAPTLIPLDESGKEKRITFENFGETVFLYIDDVGDNDGDE